MIMLVCDVLKILYVCKFLFCRARHSTDDDKKANSQKFKDTSYIELALRVLGLMCDGQYRPLQNYLRQQPDNIKNINLVSETCIFLSSFYVDVTNDNIELINTALKTLIEMSVVSCLFLPCDFIMEYTYM